MPTSLMPQGVEHNFDCYITHDDLEYGSPRSPHTPTTGAKLAAGIGA